MSSNAAWIAFSQHQITSFTPFYKNSNESPRLLAVKSEYQIVSILGFYLASIFINMLFPPPDPPPCSLGRYVMFLEWDNVFATSTAGKKREKQRR